MSSARCVVRLVLSATFSIAVAVSAQTTNPAYLAGLPTVERVKHDLKGKDATDTLARQVSVFTYLPAIIDRMANGPGRKYGQRTPDEIKYSTMYGLAGYEMSQAYAKSHTPEEAKAFEQLHGRYEVYNALPDILSLSTPEFVAEYGKFDKAALAAYRAHVEQEKRDNNYAKPFEEGGQPGGQPANGSTAGMRNDPGTREARRCLELGGSELECIGKGMKTGFFDMLGVNPNLLGGAAAAGLRMTGIYGSANELSLTFDDDAVSISGCGKLVPDSHQYNVTKRGDQLLINIANQPKPMVVTLGADGKIVGPGPTDVTGKVIVGYRRYWVEKRRVSDNSIIPGSGHEESEPIFAPKTERCTVASFRPLGPTGTAGTAIKTVTGILGTGKTLEQSAEEASRDLPPPGPRMAGAYASPGGFHLEFNTLGAVLECGEAHIMKPYAVQNTADRIIVTVQAAPPLTLTLQPNGTLAGPASVDVNGRVVTGTTDSGVSFAPRNARCPAGTLVSSRGGS